MGNTPLLPILGAPPCTHGQQPPESLSHKPHTGPFPLCFAQRFSSGCFRTWAGPYSHIPTAGLAKLSSGDSQREGTWMVLRTRHTTHWVPWRPPQLSSRGDPPSASSVREKSLCLCTDEDPENHAQGHGYSKFCLQRIIRNENIIQYNVNKILLILLISLSPCLNLFGHQVETIVIRNKGICMRVWGYVCIWV